MNYGIRHTRKAEIVAIYPSKSTPSGFIAGYVELKDEKGEIHHMIDGSFNRVIDPVVGDTGIVQYIVEPGLALWYWKKSSENAARSLRSHRQCGFCGRTLVFRRKYFTSPEVVYWLHEHSRSELCDWGDVWAFMRRYE